MPFVAPRRWLDTLGSAAKQGVSLVARQSLLQGSSRLLDERFSPLPDFWLSLFHKRLVGGRVLRLRAQPGTDPVRLYAHCLRDGAVKGRRGAVVLLAVNLSNDTVLLRPKDPELRASHVMQYALGPKGPLDLLSEDVQLNGRLLAINDKLQFPDIVPVVLHPSQSLILKPHGAAFFVFADYRAPACTATF
ncbi:heparanase-like [Ixodes scapularis]|uniref:heparanase-like n=1 Tax=Ixodes scapularis TaxID=6945 RepID=UPI001A9FB1AB|nr:heparanase-like [Ixodes scapularis]